MPTTEVLLPPLVVPAALAVASTMTRTATAIALRTRTLRIPQALLEPNHRLRQVTQRPRLRLEDRLPRLLLLLTPRPLANLPMLPISMQTRQPGSLARATPTQEPLATLAPVLSLERLVILALSVTAMSREHLATQATLLATLRPPLTLITRAPATAATVRTAISVLDPVPACGEMPMAFRRPLPLAVTEPSHAPMSTPRVAKDRSLQTLQSWSRSSSRTKFRAIRRWRWGR